MRANALAVMAKAPLAGQVKTRLLSALSPEEAAEVARCLLVDQLQHLSGFPDADLYLAFAPADERALMEPLAPSPFRLFAQQGADLGARMHSVFQTLHAKGYRNVVLIGGDLAPIPLATCAEAFAVLEGSPRRVVLGPSRDGGYYLVGCNDLVPEIFARMTWSHGEVLNETLARLSALAISTRLLPPGFDVDTVDDLRAFPSRLDPALAEQAANTLRLIRRLGLCEG